METKTESRGTVLILTAEPPEQFGGTEHFIRMVRCCLEGKDYSVEVVHRGNCGIPWKRRSEIRYIAYIQDFLLGLFAGRCAKRVLQRRGESVRAIVSSGLVGWYPLKSEVPQVHLYHGTYRQQAEAIRPLISTLGYLKQKWWESMVLERASGRGKLVLVNSNQTAQEVKLHFGHQSVTLWCPLDTNHFRPLDRDDCRRILKIPHSRRVGLFVGNIHPVKGFPVVRALLDRLPDIHWILAIRGELPTGLRATAGVQVFHNVDYQKLPLFYASADFSLSPSRYESFGYVVAESLACGTPVIATPGGASRLLLREPPLREMFIEDSYDAEPFVEAVRKLLLNPTLYREAVLKTLRPLIETLMSSPNWCKRFAQVTGL